MKWSSFILLLLACLTLSVQVEARDSLRVEFKNGKAFVLHQVEAKETLFSLSRRYHTSVGAIQKLNKLDQNSLALGTVLRIPFGKTVIHPVSAGETLYGIAARYQVTMKELRKWNDLGNDQVAEGFVLYIGANKPENAAKISPPVDQTATATTTPASNSFHIVSAKETVYGIARKYGLTVPQLQQLNNLEDYNVSIGDTLFLQSAKTEVDEQTPMPTEELTAEVSTEELVIQPSVSSKSKSSGPTKAIKEKGIATVFPDNDTKKYLALHRDAPVGTIMQVRNEMTNLTVFVRVVGRLPNTGDNNNVLLKLSQAAQQGLGALDNRFRVEISYIPAK